MARFVPKDKLGRKARKELDRRRRKTWEFSPVTKTVESGKLYNRKKIARDCRDDSTDDFFLLSEAFAAYRGIPRGRMPAVRIS